MTVGFIGLGIMGQPIAGHLLAAGHDLAVHSRTRAKAEPLLADGAQWVKTPSEVAAAADVVLDEVVDEEARTGGQMSGTGRGRPSASIATMVKCPSVTLTSSMVLERMT
jgi:3-hydroxyisobutyrate dehydrogenase